jgi:hypothetical protein
MALQWIWYLPQTAAAVKPITSTDELGYNVMKGFVSLKTSVFLAEEYNAMIQRYGTMLWYNVMVQRYGTM